MAGSLGRVLRLAASSALRPQGPPAIAVRARGRGNGAPPPPQPPMSWRDLVLPVIVLIALNLSSGREQGHKEVTWQEFRTKMLSQGEVKRLVVDKRAEKVYVYLEDGAYIEGYSHGRLPMFRINIANVAVFEEQLKAAQEELGIPSSDHVVVVYSEENVWKEVLVSLIPVAIVGGALLFIMRRSGAAGGLGIGGAGGKGGGAAGGPMAAGKIKPHVTTKENSTVTFKQVAGLTEAKAEVQEFASFMQDASSYQSLGAKVPRGALLVGPPGTGKTLLAKAVAGEASVPFFSVSGSDFVEMYVGVGAARVRDLFKQARENAPCIVYIDEIDAVGRKRSGGKQGGGNSERETTLNQLLVEMDGFNTDEHILLLASTNRADMLDPALLRPGRFDRQITCDLPTLSEREDIFRVHLAPLTVAEDVLKDGVPRLANLTPGMSGAQIASICNEAALHAARANNQVVQQDDFDYAVDRVVAGIERPNKYVTKQERRVTAVHEAGHTLVGWLLKHTDPVMKVSLVPRSNGSLGHTQFVPSDQKLYTTEQLFDRCVALLAGRAAEQVAFGRVSTGAGDDLKRVTEMATAQVTQYGMSDSVGPLVYNIPSPSEPGTKQFSQNVAARIDREVAAITRRAYDHALELVRQKEPELNKLADQLLKTDVLHFDDVLSILGPRPHEAASTAPHIGV